MISKLNLISLFTLTTVCTASLYAGILTPINSKKLPKGIKDTRFLITFNQKYTITVDGKEIPLYGQQYKNAVTDFKIKSIGFNRLTNQQAKMYIIQEEGAPKILTKVQLWLDQTPVPFRKFKQKDIPDGQLTTFTYMGRWKDAGTFFFDRSVEGNFRNSKDKENPPADGLLPILTAPNNRLRQKVLVKIWKLNPKNKLSVTLDGKEVFNKSGNLEHNEHFVVDYTHLKRGDHQLTFNLYDDSTKKTITKIRKWKTFHDGIPKFGLGEYNYFHKNGKKFFPIGCWYTSKRELDKGFKIPYGKKGPPTKDAPRYSNTPSLATINCVVGTEWGPAKKYTPEYYSSFVDTLLAPRGLYAATHGSKAFYSAMEASDGHDFKDALTAWVNALKDHPNNMAWYIEDEPEFKMSHRNGKKHWTLGGVRNATEWVRDLDSNFPVWINHVGKYFTNMKTKKGIIDKPFAFECYFFGLNGYIPQHDVFGIDHYPYSGLNRKYYKAMGAIGLINSLTQLDNVSKWNLGMVGKACFIEICCVFPEENKKVGKGLRNPVTPSSTNEQVWNQVWLSIIHDCNTITWFQYFRTQQIPYVYESMLRTKEWVTALADVICTQPDPVKTEVKILSPKGRVDVSSRLTKDKGLFIMAADVRDTLSENEQPKDLREWKYTFHDKVKAKITVEGLKDGQKLYVIGEDRSVTVMDGSIEDSFDILQVHLYTTDKNMYGITSPAPKRSGPIDPKGWKY